jgi:hypothetical protein
LLETLSWLLWNSSSSGSNPVFLVFLGYLWRLSFVPNLKCFCWLRFCPFVPAHSCGNIIHPWLYCLYVINLKSSEMIDLVHWLLSGYLLNVLRYVKLHLPQTKLIFFRTVLPNFFLLKDDSVQYPSWGFYIPSPLLSRGHIDLLVVPLACFMLYDIECCLKEFFF